MAFHKAREEKKWKCWKEREEKQLREHRADFPDYELLPSVQMEEPELDDTQRLLHTIEDEGLLRILLGADRGDAPDAFDEDYRIFRSRNSRNTEYFRTDNLYTDQTPERKNYKISKR